MSLARNHGRSGEAWIWEVMWALWRILEIPIGVGMSPFGELDLKTSFLILYLTPGCLDALIQLLFKTIIKPNNQRTFFHTQIYYHEVIE